jgi:hypothetical protein
MRRYLLPILCVLYVLPSVAQDDKKAFKGGEFLKYKIQYGLVNAGMMTVELEEKVMEEDTLLHSIGKGWTTGMIAVVFKVEDRYETFFEKSSQRPVHFIRKVNEGGYTKDKEIYFDFNSHYATVLNHKHQTEESYFIQNDVQDMLSSFYYLREINFDALHEGDSIDINMFFDQKMNRIRVLVLGRERIKSNFGQIDCIKIRPLVQEGRVFKDEENVTLWITDDLNRIPIKIKSSILVGSIKAELIDFKGLAHPFRSKI